MVFKKKDSALSGIPESTPEKKDSPVPFPKVSNDATSTYFGMMFCECGHASCFHRFVPKLFGRNVKTCSYGSCSCLRYTQRQIIYPMSIPGVPVRKVEKSLESEDVVPLPSSDKEASPPVVVKNRFALS